MNLKFGFVVFLILNAGVCVAAEFERIEVPIGQIFVTSVSAGEPAEIVLDGILPNGCYAVSDFSTSAQEFQVHPHLFALHRTAGPCADESHLAASLQPPVPYTLSVSLGVLVIGDYTVVYPRPGLPDGLRPFSVQKARVPRVIAPLSASVSSVWVSDSVRGDLPISVELVGSLTRTCTSLLPDVSVKLQGDVFEVLPLLHAVVDPFCAFEMKPFQTVVTLPPPGEGRFLIHVQSADGGSVNRAFSAVVRDPE